MACRYFICGEIVCQHPRRKRGACSYPARGAASGGMTAARRAIFIAAFRSAWAENPHDLHKELRLRLSIGLLTMPALAARLAGIGRVHIDHPHPRQCRLVGDEGAELKEGPRVQHSPLAFLNRFPSAFADVREVFKRNPALGAFRRADKGLRQTVIHVLGEALLAPAALPEQPLGRLRALLLELLRGSGCSGHAPD